MHRGLKVDKTSKVYNTYDFIFCQNVKHEDE